MPINDKNMNKSKVLTFTIAANFDVNVWTFAACQPNAITPFSGWDNGKVLLNQVLNSCSHE
jgi:hypothetical protein